MKSNFLTNYLKNSSEEFHKITWPTKDTAIKLTLTVFAVCIIAIIVFGLVDFVLQTAIEKAITL